MNVTNALSQEHVVVLAQLLRFEKGLEPVDLDRMQATLRFFDQRVVLHRRKEEEALFPALAKHIGVDGGPVGCMLEEHREEREQLEAIRAALSRPLTEGSRATIQRAGRHIVVLLRGHIEKEDTVLFPLAEEILGEEEKRRVKAAMDKIGYCTPE